MLLVMLMICSFRTPSQAQTPSKQQQPDDVIRINTDLVQTDVTVVDKRGRFIDGLKPEQFELRVDTKLQRLAFLNRLRPAGCHLYDGHAGEFSGCGRGRIQK
jgi:hypothetical protein